MKQFCILIVACLFTLSVAAQKKPLDHSVYDGWQSIGEKLISNNGKWIVYSVTPQEGDADLFIQSASGDYKKQVARGYDAQITEDSRFVVFKIKPFYIDTREARIRKKKADELPKDSIGILALGSDTVFKKAMVRSFKLPAKASGWVAYQKEKEPASRSSNGATQKTVDSLRKTIDSLVLLVTEIKNIKAGNKDEKDADEEPSSAPAFIEGSDLVLRNLEKGSERTFKRVRDYLFNEEGQKLVLHVTRSAKDSTTANAVLVVDLAAGRVDTIIKGGNEFKNFAITEDGRTVAFLAERDTAAKTLQKFYGLYVYESGSDSARLFIDKNSVGMQLGMTVSEHGTISFSKSGKRLFFGTAPIPPAKDTSLVDIDLVKLDIWHYNDDYLQTQQLSRLATELKRNYLAVYDLAENKMEHLGSEVFPNIIQTDEGDGAIFIAVTDTGRRVESQWTGTTKKDVYAVNVSSGKKLLVKKNHDGLVYPSATGKYILLYDHKVRQYLSWDGRTLKNITSKIKVPLFNEESDTPDDPNPYGVMGWHEGDSAVYVYDRYDIWKVDPAGIKNPLRISQGRPSHTSYRYIKLDKEEKYVTSGQLLFFKAFDERSKKSGFVFGNTKAIDKQCLACMQAVAYNGLQKAKEADVFIYTKESYISSPDLYLTQNTNATAKAKGATEADGEVRISSINRQQSNYNWGNAELFKWKAFNGKTATGILYKPENFDSTRKYPMIVYFYEKLSDGLHTYIAPEPTRSRLNIPFFVSRGYLVFAPDIHYTKGHPGKDAYTYIVSGAQALSKKKWVDAKNIGLQGQSWGGYQVAHLITATNMFKAAWAGAPVVNMFSAYGGIRWESGNNRQFQYEKGQSRIGATPWDRPDLYIENSPFFHLKKVKTPLVIMANDADGAVPWYQGIEFFTALRRLGKKVWMLNYNGEAHNLVERKNKKDIQVREQQFFDWLLKGDKPADWLMNGVPAVKKGKDWGLQLVDGTE